MVATFRVAQTAGSAFLAIYTVFEVFFRAHGVPAVWVTTSVDGDRQARPRHGKVIHIDD
jgi:hypothetical protein